MQKVRPDPDLTPEKIIITELGRPHVVFLKCTEPRQLWCDRVFAAIQEIKDELARCHEAFDDSAKRLLLWHLRLKLLATVPTVVYEDFRGEAAQDLFTRLLTQVKVKSQCTAQFIGTPATAISALQRCTTVHAQQVRLYRA